MGRIDCLNAQNTRADPLGGNGALRDLRARQVHRVGDGKPLPLSARAPLVAQGSRPGGDCDRPPLRTTRATVQRCSATLWCKVWRPLQRTRRPREPVSSSLLARRRAGLKIAASFAFGWMRSTRAKRLMEQIKSGATEARSVVPRCFSAIRCNAGVSVDP
jgi:hypothetical protein